MSLALMSISVVKVGSRMLAYYGALDAFKLSVPFNVAIGVSEILMKVKHLPE